MIILVLVILVMAAVITYMLMNEERPVLFPQPTFIEIMVRMQRAIGDAAVTIGEAFIPALRQAAEAINKFAEALTEKSQDAYARVQDREAVRPDGQGSRRAGDQDGPNDRRHS